MNQRLRRSTIYLDASLHKALRIKAASTQKSVSALVNEALLRALQEDSEDLKAFEARAAEPEVTYEALLKDLKAHDRI